MTYPGGKNACYHHIINQIPPHRVYIEAFYGSGAIMKMKEPAKINIGVDLDFSVCLVLSLGMAMLQHERP